jgi:hypothetical protein
MGFPTPAGVYAGVISEAREKAKDGVVGRKKGQSPLQS